MAVRLMPWALWQASLLALALSAAVSPPRWADPSLNPCAALPGGWQLLQWPGDGRCYRIFTVGAPGPCPATQELAPHARSGAATCRCPPGSAQWGRREDPDGPCYALYGRGPCDTGHYFAPVPPPRADDPDHRRLGQCLPLERCATEGHVFWPARGRCYPALSRGPCPKGELLVGPDGEGDGKGKGLPRCACSRHGPLGAHFWAGGGDGGEADGGGACFEHFTRGPCLESGQLFLPDGRCGCHEGLPHFHAATGRCYPLGGSGPCASGQHFVSAPGEARARCVCRPGHVAWAPDASAAAPAAPCHRLYTRGPCGEGRFLLDGATCAAQCPRGRLYFPERGACFRVGLRGPCAQGRVVVFEDAVSLRGRCAAPASAPAAPCDARAGLVRWDAACHPLYTRGPCPEHQWLVPAREGRPGAGPGGVRRAARCECRPGFEPGPADGQCRPPAVAIADFLNRKYRPEADGAAGENDA